MDDRLNSLKRHVFYELMNIAGRVFILVRASESVVLGKRSLTPEEEENGIVLVFNPGMKFHWDDYGITATLVFGSLPEKCVIPADAIQAVYSPEVNAQFIMAQPRDAGAQSQPVKQSRGETLYEPPGKVIKVDFTKKNKP